MTLHFDVHGNGEPLLLLHGFTGASENWAATVHQWSDRYQLIVPDLPGHGRSGTLARPFRHRDAAVEVLALLDRLGIPSCKGLGISCGGNVLLHMATMQPERVAKNGSRQRDALVSRIGAHRNEAIPSHRV